MSAIHGIILGVLVLFMQGCIGNKAVNCGVEVRFRYVKNPDTYLTGADVDKFAGQVNSITLFLFDDKGIFIDQFREESEYLNTGQGMRISLGSGNYKLVAWGNLCEDYILPQCAGGVTSINDLHTRINHESGNVDKHPAHLFFGSSDIKISGEETYMSITIDLTKDTNYINVTKRGLPVSGDIAGSDFKCIITAYNEACNFDNTIVGDTRLTYTPLRSVNDDSHHVSEFVTMRELNGGEAQSKLIITYEPGGVLEKELVNVPLTPLLLQVARTNDLDIDDEFYLDVEFDFANGTAVISINGWVITEDEWVLG